MFLYKSILLQSIFSCLLFFSSNFIPVSAQEVSSYKGDYVLSSITGQAKYSYKVIEGDTVKEGKFKFQKTNYRELLGEGDGYLSLQGIFKNGVPSGEWNFRKGNFTSGSFSSLENTEYQVTLNGVLHTATGSLLQGKPDGEWKHVVQKLNDSEQEELLFESTLNFTLGVPQKSFSIGNQDNTLVGRFLRDGWAHDVWELFGLQSLEHAEKWMFQEGRLLSVSIVDNDQTQNYQIYANPLQNPVELDLGREFVNIVRLRIQLYGPSKQQIFRSKMVDMIEENAFYYSRVDSLLRDLGNYEFQPQYKVLVEHYPINQVHMGHLTTIEQITRESNQLMNEILSNTQLQLLKLSDEETAFLYAVTENIQSEYGEPLMQLSDYFQKGWLEYFIDTDILQFIWENKSMTEKVETSYEFDDVLKEKTFGLSKSFVMDSSNYSYELVRMAAETIHQSLKEIDAILFTKVERMEKEELLEEKETVLIQEVNRLNDTVDSLEVTVGDPYLRVVTSIQDYQEAQLKSYTGLETIEEKLIQVDSLTLCTNQLTLLADSVGRLPAKEREIQLYYIDDVWNPFTATLMEEDMKRPITNSYKETIIPTYLFNLESKISCDNVGTFQKRLTTIHSRMKELRDEETYKIERKLRRSKDYREILELLNMVTVKDDE